MVQARLWAKAESTNLMPLGEQGGLIPVNKLLLPARDRVRAGAWFGERLLDELPLNRHGLNLAAVEAFER